MAQRPSGASRSTSAGANAWPWSASFLHLLKATQGAVTVFGEDIAGYTVAQLARRIGYVHQNPDTQIFCRTVAEEVSFGPAHLLNDPAEVERRLHEALAAMELQGHEQRHPLALSRGERERLAIAAVLAMEPEVLILDEPTTGQDHAGARYVMEMVRRLHRGGRTVIVVTHHLHLLPDCVTRVVFLKAGRILLDAPTRRALHERDLMRATHLLPPQIVELAQEIERLGGARTDALTVEECCALFPGNGDARWR